MFGISTVPGDVLGFFVKFRFGIAVDAAMIGLIAFCKIVTQLKQISAQSLLARFLPVVSMVAICIVLGIITAQTRDVLLTVGYILVVAALIHNSCGYALGYWGSMLIGKGIVLPYQQISWKFDPFRIVSILYTTPGVSSAFSR